MASITKTFTSAAIALLVQEGKLGFDDPVSKHLSELAAITGLDTDAITVEHLLSHQAGFDGDQLFVEGATDSFDLLHGARRFFEPGTGFSYNNAAFSIAGAVIEAVAGESYASFIRHRLLVPLDMKSACFRADDAITHRVAAPHLVIGDEAAVLRRAGWQPGWELSVVDHAAGGLLASVEHLLAWARFQWTGQAADGTQLLSTASLERLHTPVVSEDVNTDVALDWFVHTTDGVTTIEHGGLTVGYCSEFVVAPARRAGVVCLTNSTNGSSVNQAVRRWALARVADVHETDPLPDPTIAIDPARFTGTYFSAFAMLTVEAGETPGTLRITASTRDDTTGWKPPPDPPMSLAFFAEDHAVSVDALGPPRVVRFGFDADGPAAWLLWGSRHSPRVG